MELLYRRTRDGMSADIFLNKYNIKGQTISIFKNNKGYVSSTDWVSCNSYISSTDSFIFTLTNIYKIAPTKFRVSNSCASIYDN